MVAANCGEKQPMKKHTIKKLAISKETVRKLEENRLALAHGQVEGLRPVQDWTGDSKNVCCA
jgi:hypothetical protein